MAIYQFALHNVRCAGCVRSVEKSLNSTEDIQGAAPGIPSNIPLRALSAGYSGNVV